MARYSKQKSRMNRDEHSAFVPMLKPWSRWRLFPASEKTSCVS